MALVSFGVNSDITRSDCSNNEQLWKSEEAPAEVLMIVKLLKGRSSDAAERSALCSRLDRPPNLTLIITTHALSGLLVTVPEANFYPFDPVCLQTYGSRSER